MATEIYFDRFPGDDIQHLYLERMFPGATAISGSTCCHRNYAAIATQKRFYSSFI